MRFNLTFLRRKVVFHSFKFIMFFVFCSGGQSFQLNAGQRQILQLQEEAKRAKVEKKRQKASKKPPSPTFDPKREQDIEKQAAELVKKMAATRMDLSVIR